MTNGAHVQTVFTLFSEKQIGSEPRILVLGKTDGKQEPCSHQQFGFVLTKLNWFSVG